MQEPLSNRLRPTTLQEIIGQQHLVKKGCILERLVAKQHLCSLIFYGPPGTGKTTLAYVLAKEFHTRYHLFNAVTGNKKDLDRIFEESKYYPNLIIIIDEVHRLNKDKQDLLLPYLENGSITLIGATTANPLHAINPAIRSRCHLLEVKKASIEDIKIALLKALESEKGLNNCCNIQEDALNAIASACQGDIRFALNLLELCAVTSSTPTITLQQVQQHIHIPHIQIGKDQDEYYDVLSAFQKAIRGSDVNAALYYLAAMIIANDMDAIERRLLVCAYEDIGLANPAAVARCIQAIDVAKRVGFPEGRIPLSNAVIDLALSPKSKSSEHAIDAAISAVQQNSYNVPDYLKFTPVQKQKEAQYDYTNPSVWPLLQYLPDHLKNATFYEPGNSGSYERALGQNYKHLQQIQRSNQIVELNKKYKNKK